MDADRLKKMVDLGGGFFAEAEAWSGNVKPFAATVYDASGKWVGRTGWCKRPSAALAAARKVVSKARERAQAQLGVLGTAAP